MPEFDTTHITSQEFPFYHTIYERGYVRGCVRNDEYSCADCLSKTFCLVSEDKYEEDTTEPNHPHHPEDI